MQSMWYLSYMSVLLAISQSAAAQFVGGCGSVAPDQFDGCVAQNAPRCKGMTPKQFYNHCCDNGIPTPSKPGCSFSGQGTVDCTKVGPDRFVECIGINAPKCLGMTLSQYQNGCCANGSPDPKPECQFNEPGSKNCIFASTNTFEFCVSVHLPLCKGMTQKQIGNSCCPSGIPIPFKPGCPFSAPGSVNCRVVPPRQFETCVATYDPECRGMTQPQFQKGCCDYATPNPWQSGCQFNHRPLQDCSILPADRFDYCVSNNIPKCKGMTREQLQKQCCSKNGNPTPSNPSCKPN